jgi:hypothetical protein
LTTKQTPPCIANIGGKRKGGTFVGGNIYIAKEPIPFRDVFFC